MYAFVFIISCCFVLITYLLFCFLFCYYFLGVEKEKERTGGDVEPPTMTQIKNALEHKDPNVYGQQGGEFYGYVYFFYHVGVASQERSILGKMKKGKTTFEHLKDKWAVTMATAGMFIQHAGDVTNIIHNLEHKRKKNNDQLAVGDTTKRGKGFTKENEPFIGLEYNHLLDYFKKLVNTPGRMERIAQWEDAIGLRKKADDTEAQKRAFERMSGDGSSHGSSGRKKTRALASMDGDTSDPYLGCLGLLSGIPGLRRLSSSCGSMDDGSTAATSFSSLNGVDDSQGESGQRITVGATGGILGV